MQELDFICFSVCFAIHRTQGAKHTYCIECKGGGGGIKILHLMTESNDCYLGYLIAVLTDLNVKCETFLQNQIK